MTTWTWHRPIPVAAAVAAMMTGVAWLVIRTPWGGGGGERYVWPLAVLGSITVAAVFAFRCDALEREVRDLRDKVDHLSAREQQHQEALSNAEEAVRLRTEFLSVASHELRSPVTSLRGYAQWLPRHLSIQPLGEDRKILSALAVIERQSSRVAELIAQLLDISRIESGKLALEVESADLGSLVGAVVSAVRVNAGTKQILVHAPASPVMVPLDRSRIEQVVVNLLENALKFDQSDHPIEVTVEHRLGGDPDASEARVVVRDHGAGIPEADRERIFERYQQAHDGGHGGLGLGLFISREIVEAHGGRLMAESPASGGARVVMTLPLSLSARAHAEVDSLRSVQPAA